MLGRLVAPAIKKMAAIDLTNFICAIVWSENAINSVILNLKQEWFRDKNKRQGGGS
jgi:hypothetical protein